MKPKGNYPRPPHVNPADAEIRKLRTLDDSVVQEVGKTLEREGPRATLKKHQPVE